jgi:pimeloyl-ACP methyl ester carboxylesterase
MAYMDVKPEAPNGRTMVLLHGKNFCAATWRGSIAAQIAAGYRVIAPDQIGFCKSTKPAHPAVASPKTRTCSDPGKRSASRATSFGARF